MFSGNTYVSEGLCFFFLMFYLLNTQSQTVVELDQLSADISYLYLSVLFTLLDFHSRVKAAQPGLPVSSASPDQQLAS